MASKIIKKTRDNLGQVTLEYADFVQFELERIRDLPNEELKTEDIRTLLLVLIDTVTDANLLG